jgi:hypothetical protein
MIRFLHTADLHLGRFPEDLRGRLRGPPRRHCRLAAPGVTPAPEPPATGDPRATRQRSRCPRRHPRRSSPCLGPKRP